MQPHVLPQSPPTAPGGNAARLVGWFLLVPAVVLTVLTLVVPTVATFVTSMHSENLIPGAQSEYVGFENYEAVFDRGLWPSLWFALSLVTVPMIVAVVVAPLLAAAIDWAGAWARWTARIVLSLTIVVFSPVALSIAWQRERREDDPNQLADIVEASWSVRSAVGMMTFGVVCAVGLMIFLPVFRAREQRRSMWPALFTTAGLAVLGVIAIGLQQFTIPFVMTAFGPARTTMTPVGLLFDSGFRQFRAGPGAAVGSVLLVLLAILGVAAVLVLILTRLRVSLLPLRRPPSDVRPAVNPGAVALAIVVLVAVVVAIVLNALPWLDALAGTEPRSVPGTEGRTWGPAVTGAMVSVGAAYLAALGISGLRPLGRHSEWLLMPFAPWLFVGIAPLSIEFFKSVDEDGGIDASGALRPPILISIISLVIIAVLCRGQSELWRRQVAAGAPAGSAFVTTVVLPTLPLAGLLFVVTMFFTAQDLVWPLLVAATPENGTAVLALLQYTGAFNATDVSVASATPLLAVVLGALAVAALQALHLDRMIATTGEAPSTPWPPQTPPAAPSPSAASL